MNSQKHLFFVRNGRARDDELRSCSSLAEPLQTAENCGFRHSHGGRAAIEPLRKPISQVRRSGVASEAPKKWRFSADFRAYDTPR
ncbi:MAG TPA: hypothetical protein VH331_14315 [Allosphingosinicella sp.]|nr:hypothetical protein [Allosphingosinicella sp.]